jgi:hypothetical protein
MNNLININLQEKLDQFPPKLKKIAYFMIESLNNDNFSEANVVDRVERKIDQLVLEDEKDEAY